MKKIRMILFFTLFFGASGVSQTPALKDVRAKQYGFENKTYIYSGYFIDLKNPRFYFSFKDGTIEIAEPAFNTDEEKWAQAIVYTAPYALIRKDGFLYLHTDTRRFLILFSGEVCLLKDCNSTLCLWGLEKSSKYILRDTVRGYTSPFLFQPQYQSFSSFLTETINGVKFAYNRENKRYYLEINPWVEGISGDGIGEVQTVNVPFGSDTFLFLNGFIDSGRPDLYLKNSRIKELIVRNGTFQETITLKDSPEPQIIQFACLLEGEVSFEIKSVYKGTKYEDTAMSGILYLRIPPER
ncbi:hypothetical protein [Treponema sp. Marseille-Q4132]|uniref:NADase-type glycan-binding domain-containing protein n=1 Tax=Treponema sp. Marseille-Q4132 TaxID=2766701 RepID=UPI0016533ACF|nr:hypothetical protein [Treponema sp. Marseille-Q4132]QNL97816.1 hypothetical protein H9I35_03410 [Treponema sp. Marseille-Q4132]